MTSAEFKTRYPEFRAVWAASDASLDGWLSDAARLISERVFGDAYDVAHGLLVAHMISVAPGSQGARKDPKRPAPTGYKATTYGEQFERLRDGATCMLRPGFPR